MRQEGDHLFWKKGEKTSLSEHFTSSEFDCHCSSPTCNEQRIHAGLIDKLGEIRQSLNRKIIVTSGYRCQEHQTHLKTLGFKTAVGVSQHQLGQAADIVPSEIRLFPDLLALCEQSFMSIGVSENRFIHVDLRNDKTRSWTY